MNQSGAQSEPEGEGELWCLDSLTPAERAQLRRAFRRSPELREELERTVLARLPEAIREQFAVAFANRLADAVRPQVAVVPALIDAARAVRPRPLTARGGGDGHAPEQRRRADLGGMGEGDE